jgi:hypothetical protein
VFSLWRKDLITVPVLKSSLRPLPKQIPSVPNPVGGMLEHATLLLRPPDALAVQAIVTPITEMPLGFVRPRPLGWLERWLGGAVLEVREHEDASLLCTIRNGWLRPQSRLVYDAEDRGVGMVRGRRLEDRNGRVLAVRRPNTQLKCDVFRDSEGRSLATLRTEAKGVVIAFTDGAAEDPFTRMLILAAALHG